MGREYITNLCRAKMKDSNEWCDYSLCWEARAIGSSESISLGEFRPDEIVAIGNAIDNPELLEV